MKMRHNPNELSYKNIYMYGMGEFGYTFYLNLISSYLMFFMTDILVMPTNMASIIYTSVQWVEAISSLIAGVMIDRLCSRRGRYRPWLLRGSVICMVCMTIVYTNFHTGNIPAAVIFTVFYSLGYIGYNFMFIAYRSLLNLIAHKPEETVALTIGGTQLSTAASLLFGFFGVRLLFSVFPSQETGFSVTSLLCGAFLVLGMAFVYIMSRPFDTHEEKHFSHKHATEKLTPSNMLKAIAPMLPCCIGFIFSVGASTLLFTMLAYYFSAVRQNSNLMSLLITITTIFRFIATFFVVPLAKRFEKKTIFCISCGLCSVFLIAAYLLQESVIGFYSMMAIYFFFTATGSSMLMPCISDVVDYNVFRQSIQARGFLYSVASTLTYIAQFVGATAASVGMIVIHYSKSAVTPSMLEGITRITFLGTAGLTAISIIPMLFYKLNRDVMEDIYHLKNAAAKQPDQ